MHKIVLLVVGLALLGLGAYRQTFGSAVNSVDQTRCEQLVRDQNGTNAETLALLLPKCSDPGMVAMMDAQAGGAGAQDAAAQISAANKGELGSHMLNWGMVGAGIALLVGGAFAGRRRA